MRRTPTSPSWWIAAIAMGTAAVFVVMLATRSAADRASLWGELGKGCVQILVIGVVGTVLKLLADRLQANRMQAEQARAYRQDKYDLLIEATNTLRRVPVLVNADRSAKTWREQTLAVIDAGLKLRVIKHQIWSSQFAPTPPIPNWRKLIKLLTLMSEYTDRITRDFIEHQRKRDEQQREVEGADLSDGERVLRKAAIWCEISKIPSMDDVLGDGSRQAAIDRRVEAGDGGVQTRLDDLTAQLIASSDLPDEVPDKVTTWREYVVLEHLALALITRSNLLPVRNHAKSVALPGSPQPPAAEASSRPGGTGGAPRGPDGEPSGAVQ